MRLRTLLSSAVLSALVFLGAQNVAQAAPVFLEPDLNFAARSDYRPAGFTCPIEFNSSSFSMLVASSLGDNMALDTGTGFTSINSELFQINGSGSVTDTGFTYGPGFTIQFGPGIMVGEGTTSLVLQRTMVGYDGFAVVKVGLSALGSPWNVNQTLGLDLHIFNVHTVMVNGTPFLCGDVKGDLAPVVPEPASLSLIGFGLVGLVSAARRRRSA